MAAGYCCTLLGVGRSWAPLRALLGGFDSAVLEQAVKDILVSRGLGEDALLKDTDSPCKV
jgi:hypothetical protein